MKQKESSTLSPRYNINYDKPLEERCPNCNRRISRRVKKCICGMEFAI